MKLTLKAVPHIANKVAIELGRSGVVTLTQGVEPVVAAVEKILAENIKKEMALEEKANQICEEHEEDLINYDVAENMVKNIIFNAITSFVAEDSELHYAVVDKIKSYKKKYIPGTDEYEILYEKLYKEELTKRGLD